MPQPDIGAEFRTCLKEGDPIHVLQGGDPTSDKDGSGRWVRATVVSNSQMAVTVKFADDGQEVIPWKSGRIKGSGGKQR